MTFIDRTKTIQIRKSIFFCQVSMKLAYELFECSYENSRWSPSLFFTCLPVYPYLLCQNKSVYRAQISSKKNRSSPDIADQIYSMFTVTDFR